MKVLKFEKKLIQKKTAHEIRHVELYLKTVSEKFEVFLIKISMDGRAFFNRKQL